MQTTDTTTPNESTPEELVSQIMRAVQSHIAIHSADQLQAKLLGIVAPGHEAMNASNQGVAPEQMGLDLDLALSIARPGKNVEIGPAQPCAEGVSSHAGAPSHESSHQGGHVQSRQGVPEKSAEQPHPYAAFAAKMMFLEWNRSQDKPFVQIAYEYSVCEKAIDLYFEALEKVKRDAQNGVHLRLFVERDII